MSPGAFSFAAWLKAVSTFAGATLKGGLAAPVIVCFSLAVASVVLNWASVINLLVARVLGEGGEPLGFGASGFFGAAGVGVGFTVPPAAGVPAGVGALTGGLCGGFGVGACTAGPAAWPGSAVA
jgi:hypothetical protein